MVCHGVSEGFLNLTDGFLQFSTGTERLNVNMITYSSAYSNMKGLATTQMLKNLYKN